MNNKWDIRFIKLAMHIATWSKDPSTKVGAVIVDTQNRIISVGFNGYPHGIQDDDLDDRESKLLKIIHAEQNAICQAARLGISLMGSTLYCRMTPCRTCAMLIINCGINRVVCENKYHAGAESEVLFRDAGVVLDYVSKEVVQYRDQ